MDRGREKRAALHGRWRSLPGGGDCSAEPSEPLASKNQNSKTKKRKNRRTGKNRAARTRDSLRVSWFREDQTRLRVPGTGKHADCPGFSVFRLSRNPETRRLSPFCRYN